MPAWQPNWQDVRFDHGAVAEAVAECERARALLAGAEEGHWRAAEAAAADWTGSAAGRFEGQRQVIQAAFGAANDALTESIIQLEAAAEAAAAEQRRRERDRERWHDERRAEQFRAESASTPYAPGP